jgi:hypothetical protein
MAREAKLPYEYDTGRTLYLKELERFAALVAAAEREAFIALIENYAQQYHEPVWAFGLIKAIRARGQS